MGKGTVTLYADQQKVENLRKLGYSVGVIFDSAMDVVLSKEFDDLNIGLRLAEIDSRILEIRDDLKELNTRRKVLDDMLGLLESSREQLKRDYAVHVKTAKLARMMSEFNKITIAADYDVGIVKDSAGELISRIQAINPNFDPDNQIRRFKDVMSY